MNIVQGNHEAKLRGNRTAQFFFGRDNVLHGVSRTELSEGEVARSSSRRLIFIFFNWNELTNKLYDISTIPITRSSLKGVS